MSRDIVGIDFGQSRLKAVRSRRRLTGQESITWYDEERPPAADDRSGPDTLPVAGPASQDGLAERLHAFLAEHQLLGARVVTALPCREAFVRTLALPFQDRKKLGQVVPFEVEALLPISLDDLTIDYHVYPGTGADGASAPHADILVAAAPKRAVHDHLALLLDAGISAGAVDLDALALCRVAQALAGAEAGTAEGLAVIDLGAATTTLCLLDQGRPRIMRTIPWGHRHLDREIARREASTEAAVESRRQPVSAGDMDSCLTPLVHELRLSLHAFTAATGRTIRHSWFCGEGAATPDLAIRLQQQLALTPMGDEPSQTLPCPREFSMAFGLAVRPRPSWRPFAGSHASAPPRLDFKQAAAATTRAGLSTRSLALAAGAALLLGLLAIGDLALQVWLKESRVATATAQVKAEFAQLFPGITPAGDEVEQAQALLTSAKKTLALLGGSTPPILTRLTELNRRVPKDLALKIVSLTVESSAVHLEAETDSFESVEKMKEAMRTFPGAQDVTVADARVGAAPHQVLFRLTVNLP